MDPITILALGFSIIVILGWVVFTHNRINKLEELLTEMDEDLEHVEDFLENNAVPLEEIKQ